MKNEEPVRTPDPNRPEPTPEDREHDGLHFDVRPPEDQTAVQGYDPWAEE